MHVEKNQWLLELESEQVEQVAGQFSLKLERLLKNIIMWNSGTHLFGSSLVAMEFMYCAKILLLWSVEEIWNPYGDISLQ